MATWQIKPDEYLQRLNLDAKDLKKKLRFPDFDALTKIVPLKDLDRIETLIPIGRDLALHLLRQVQTLDGRKAFENIRIKMIKIDPRQVRVGQKYVYRENYQKLLENVPGIFKDFLVSAGGMGDLGAYFIFGYNGDNSYALACYLPPIIERHGQNLVIMDGIHRDYIAMQTGLALNAIIIDNPSLPFPCSAQRWSSLSVISSRDKPKELKDRYFDLEAGLFRDLKYLGIDG